MAEHILSIDQGTTSSRAIVFTGDGRVVADAQQEFGQIFPADGWVEHDPQEIWRTVEETSRAALEKAGLQAADIAGIGITNQRETTVVWDRASGTPIYNAIVWQDRRTAPLCDQLRAEGREKDVEACTGLLLDPYFSGTKVKWILDNVEGARTKADAGALAFGTIDCWLLWRLTGGAVHATDATNASRTMLFNIDTQHWDQNMLQMLSVPDSLMPDVKDNAAIYGETTENFLGA
ncbi:MAG: FGGY family carbohydrate kinase, partial [Alphaproteobacteria bacterium]